MSSSFTFIETIAFTITHARHMAAKIATDLKRMQRFYGEPSDAWIDAFEQEMIALLKANYLGTAFYGYQKNGAFIEPTLIYTARDLACALTDDDDPGRVRPGADTSGAHFHSFLTYSAAWWALSGAEQAAFEARLPFQRTSGMEPSIKGYLRADRTYSAGGWALDRQSVKAF